VNGVWIGINLAWTYLFQEHFLLLSFFFFFLLSLQGSIQVYISIFFIKEKGRIRAKKNKKNTNKTKKKNKYNNRTRIRVHSCRLVLTQLLEYHI
jgi:hypothetical protein